MDPKPLKDTAICLVVEDQPEILGTMTRALERSGWTVLGAASAAEARGLLGRELRLAVIDLGLPDCLGDEFALELRVRQPDVPILIASGGGESELLEIASRIGNARVLTKPFSMRTLGELAKASLPRPAADGANSGGA